MSNTQAERVEALMGAIQNYGFSQWAVGNGEAEPGKRQRLQAREQSHRCVESAITSLVAENQALRADAERLDWIEQRTKLNSDGISQQDMQPARHVKFTILPAWDQNGEVANLRQSIDAARNTTQQQGG